MGMKKYLHVFVLTALIFLVYANTFLSSFHFDDIPSILEKPWIRGLDKIPQFLFSIWQRPLVILSFNINYAISGFEVWSYHIFNILFHVGAALLVYRLTRLAREFLRRTRRAEASGPGNLPFLAALLFALHPLSTQSVTYISSRSSILATIFYLATLILFYRGLLKRTRTEEGARDPARAGSRNLTGLADLLGSGVCLVLGFLSKQIIVSLPVMAFLFHFYFVAAMPFGRWLAGRIKWIVLVGAPPSVLMIYKQFWGGGIASASPEAYSPATYFLTQTFVIPWEYFRKLLFPINLNIDPDFPIFSDWSQPSHWTGLLVIGIYVWVWIRLSRRPVMEGEEGTAGRLASASGTDSRFPSRWAGFGMAWILITLLPTSSFVPLLDVAVEHRTYLPMVGISILSAALLSHLIQSVRKGLGRTVFFRRHGTSLVVGAASLVLVFFAAGAVKRNGVWINEVRLWSDAKNKSPRLVRPRNNLGEAYDKQREYDKAIAEFEGALRLNPNYFFALNNLGNVYGKKKEFDRAIDYFQKALAQKPDYAPAHYNLARALQLTGHPSEALESYRRAIRFNPYFEEAFYNLANLALQSGLIDEAVENFNRFLKMRPGHARARFGLGNAYAMQGKFDLALAQFQKAVELDPGYVFPYINISNIQMQKGEVDAAIATLQKALERQPRTAGIHKNLGMIYYQLKKDPGKAEIHFRESLRLDPAQPQADIIRSLLTRPAPHGGGG
ncbi:MAG: tetratricopeptide repeat protein [Nitrospinaceae bacterium]